MHVNIIPIAEIYPDEAMRDTLTSINDTKVALIIIDRKCRLTLSIVSVRLSPELSTDGGDDDHQNDCTAQRHGAERGEIGAR